MSRGSARRRLSWLLVPCLVALGAAVLPGIARADDTTVSYDTMRTGWDSNESGLSPSAVSASDFGQLFSTAVVGQVYAQPLVVGGTLITGTEENNIYGMNPATGAILWSRNLGPAWPVGTLGCGDLTPDIGITSSPVYDPASKSVFFLAKVNDGADVSHPNFYMHSVLPTTGAERAGYPVKIAGSPSNDPTNSFNAETSHQRAGLLLLGGVVYAGFASHCDHQPYNGYIAGVKTTTAAMSTLWASETGSTRAEGGIWQSGGGLVSDGPGRIIVATGNGVSPAPGPGNKPPGQLAESVIRLQVNTDGTLAAKDFFSPVNNSKLDQDDADFGSGGPMALPDGFGTTAHPHLLVQAGKDGRVFLLDRDNLGGVGQGTGGTDASVGPAAGPYAGVWGHPAFWGGDGGYVYYVGNSGALRAFKYGVNGSGLPVLSSVATSTSSFGYTSGSPVVTSTGSTSGSAIVWVVYSSGSSGTGAQLRAYDALPVGGQMHLRYSAPIGTAAKFSVPATDGNRVFVGTRDGHVIGFGRPTTASLTSSPVDFGNVAVGSTAKATVTVTASRAVTVTGITTAAPFGATLPSLPVSLTAGQTLSVPVTFTPTGTGGSAGGLVFATNLASVSVDLHGTGTKAGLGSSPASVTFDDVPTGASQTVSVDIQNTGTSSLTISGSTAPKAPFTATGFPATGSTLAAGASVSVSVTYKPTAAGTQTSSLAVASSAGTVTVPISGTAVSGSAHLTLTPTSIDYGSVTVGQAVTKSFDISNTGNIQLTLTKAAPPAGVFIAQTPVAEGQTISPGDTIHQSVTFTPTAAGVATGSYSITGDDGQGAILVHLTGTGVAPSSTTIPLPTSASWQRNGSAKVSGTDLNLTAATQGNAGSAVYPTAVSTDGLHVRYTAQLSGGTGGDGMTFALLDPATSTSKSVGKSGGALGFGSLHGVAFTLDDHKNTGDPYSNFIGVATGATGTYYDSLTYVASQNLTTSLRTGTHVVDLTISGGVVSYSIDGGTPIRQRVAVPAKALLAFTGGTGGNTDVQAVRNVSISTGTTLTDPTTTGWTRNGTAALSGADLALTQVGQTQTAGSSFNSTVLSTTGLHASFTTTIGGGSGADGETFALQDATKGKVTGLGYRGGGLGFVGLSGIAVALDTYQGPGEPSANFLGIITGGTADKPTYAATNTTIPKLRTGTHTVDVVVSDGKVTVSIDGTQYLDTVVTVPATVLAGFTAGTGGSDDNHLVRGVSITAVS